MEKHGCKLCLKSFANGRALGGHMRSHTLNLYVPPKTEPSRVQLSEQTESASYSSDDEEDENEETEDKSLLCYELRENPKRSIRIVDPEFAFPVELGSVVLQDRESETESSNPIRRRSKRVRNSGFYPEHKVEELKKPKLGRLSKTELYWVESEPVSSISDTSPEEDVAFCLMMLSRDKWRREKDVCELQEVRQQYSNGYHDKTNGEQHYDDETCNEIKSNKYNRARAKYRCETCNKVFRSYQALGGHRASHKKIKATSSPREPSIEERENAGNSTIVVEKIHECPVCFRIFSSGQALGGHKRSHVTGASATTITTAAAAKPVTKQGEILIDLNLPAPIDDGEISQIELSAVSDAEFVNPMKR